MLQHLGFRKSRSQDTNEAPVSPNHVADTDEFSINAMVTDDEDDSNMEEKKEPDSLDRALGNQESHESSVSITNMGDQIEVEELKGEKNTRGHPPAHQHSHSHHEDDAATTSTGSVSFGPVRVREYERVIDSTNIYMGLALGWSYNDVAPAPVRERNHTSKYSTGGSTAGGASHGGDESRMKRTNGSDRYGMMLRYGYAQKELKQATKEAAKFYKQRQREAARSLVVAENKKADPQKPKRRPLLRSMFG